MRSFGVEPARDEAGHNIAGLYQGAVYGVDNSDGGSVTTLHQLSEKRLPYGEAYAAAYKLYEGKKA